jgi:hypothetical protein
MKLEINNYAQCEHCIDLEKDYKEPSIGFAKFFVSMTLFCLALSIWGLITQAKGTGWIIAYSALVLLLVVALLWELFSFLKLEFWGKKLYAFYDQCQEIHIHTVHPEKESLGSWGWLSWVQRSSSDWRWMPRTDPLDPTPCISGAILCFMVGGMWRSRSEFNRIQANEEGGRLNNRFWSIADGWFLTDIVLKDNGGSKLGHLPFTEVLRLINEFRNISRYLQYLRNTEETLEDWLIPTILAAHDYLSETRAPKPSKTAAHGRRLLEAGMNLCTDQRWRKLNGGQCSEDKLSRLTTEVEAIVLREHEARQAS